MKITSRCPQSTAFTLVEMMITLSVVFLLGGLAFTFLNTGMVLYAKNTAVNAAHQQARSGIDGMLANIHAAVSIPQLVDEDLTPLPPPGTGPARGISFQKFVAGPYLLWTGQNVASTQNYLILFAPDLDADMPVTGLRFNIPSHQVEKDIQSMVAFGSYKIIYFAGAIGTDMVVNDNDANNHGNGNGNNNGTSNISGFVTQRVSYAVTGSDPYYELRYYPNNDPQNFAVIARNVTSSNPGQAPTPFAVLFNQAGGADFRSVGAVNLSTAEPEYSKRGYAAVNMFIDSYIPFRSQLTILQ
jgi:type II secretory pathway pseudopilin PulG